jgi:hypothetical protein
MTGWGPFHQIYRYIYVYIEVKNSKAIPVTAPGIKPGRLHL